MKRFLLVVLALCVLPSVAHAQCGSYLGDFRDSSKVFLWISTYDSTGAGSTVSALATSDIKIYKDGSTTQRSSTSGFALLGPDFDNADTGIVGLAGVSIDLSDNTDAGFYQRGHDYEIAVGNFTVNAITTVHCDGAFSLENRAGAIGAEQWISPVSTVDSQTSLRLTAGVGAANQFRDYLVCIDDVSSLRTRDCTWITKSDGTDIFLERALSFTVANGDLVHITTIRRK